MRSMASHRRPSRNAVRDLISISKEVAKEEMQDYERGCGRDGSARNWKNISVKIREDRWKKAAAELNFEAAAELS